MFTSIAFTTLLSLTISSVAWAAQFNVTVGGGSLKFDPEYVTANAGDTVLFTFKQSNHTATQSTLANPCSLASGGFDSGFMPVDASNTNGPFPAAVFNVQDTNPVWVYCKQGNHCQQGMVFAINPGSQFAAFQAAATGGTTTTSSPATTATAPPATTTTSAPATGSSTATTTAGSASPTSTATDHKVVVGGSTLTFTPSNITAQVGDTVTFQFMQKNHTATQSTFANPCRELTSTSTSGQIGFDSGYMPVSTGATTFPTYTIQVNDTTPIWVYCKQAGHCGQGMVFAVNAAQTGDNTFSAFQARAMQLNGTATSTPTSSSPTQTGAAAKMSTRGAGAAVGLASFVVGMFLM
ncbi:Cupredoxin [Melanogaster broomeanus]|nr:Cupredoxin [Melanogaster broomeanus]